jgi:hypothetical protein
MTGVLDLIRAAAEGRTTLDLDRLDPGELQHALKAGLGPLLHRATRDGGHGTGSSLAETVMAADLTARLLTATKLDALEQILRSAGPLAGTFVVLKGMAACLRDYPEPHLRTMGDIDLLVPPETLPVVESLLLDLGYHQESDDPPEYYETHHHSMPFCHWQTGVWVEVHTGLFPPEAPIATNDVFSPVSIAKDRAPFEFRGLVTSVLDDELHLIYTCAHWAQTVNTERGLLPLLDVVYLLRQRGARIDWARVCARLERSAAAPRVWLMLAWLDRHGLIELPPGILARLDRLSRGLDGFSGRILQRIVSRYIVGGAPFGRLATESSVTKVWDTLLAPRAAAHNLLLLPYHFLFPPRHPERYSPGLLLRRLKSILRPGAADR